MQTDTGIPTNARLAGLLDAQLSIKIANPEKRLLRVTLITDDDRSQVEPLQRFPTRQVVVRAPNKKTTAVARMMGQQILDILAFAAQHCIVKRDMARAALKYLTDETTTVEELQEALAKVPMQDETMELDREWIGGFFDSTCEIQKPSVPVQDDGEEEPSVGDEKNGDENGGEKRKGKKRRKKSARASLIVPKYMRHFIPMMQSSLGFGKIHKASPYRLIFAQQELATFLEACSDIIHVKRDDLNAIAC